MPSVSRLPSGPRFSLVWKAVFPARAARASHSGSSWVSCAPSLSWQLLIHGIVSMNKVHPLFDLLFKKFFAILKYLIFSNKFWSHLDKFLQNTTEIFCGNCITVTCCLMAACVLRNVSLGDFAVVQTVEQLTPRRHRPPHT